MVELIRTVNKLVEFKIAISKILCICTFLFIVSCSDLSGENVNGNTNNITTDVTIIGQKDNEVYQINIYNGVDVETMNLTQELGVPSTFYRATLRNFHPLITFYTYYNGGFSVWEKNIDTEASLVLDGFCELEPGESQYFPSNSTDYLLLFTVQQLGATPYINVRIYNKQTAECVKLEVGGTSQFYSRSSTLVKDNTLLVYFENEAYQKVIAKVDLANHTLDGEILFEDYTRATIDADELHVFSGLSEEHNHYVYALNDLELLRSDNAYPDTVFGPGLIEISFKGNKMLLDRSYAQPSVISLYPAIFDLDSNSYIKEADLFQARRNMQEIYPNASVTFPTHYSVDLQNELIVCGYYTNDGTQQVGGVAFVNFDGDILSYVTTDIVPYKVLIR